MSSAAGGGASESLGVGTGGGGQVVPWPTGADGYKLDKIIGKGAFATVWKAFCAARAVHVAVKVMDLENVTHSFEDIRQEVGGYDALLASYVALPLSFVLEHKKIGWVFHKVKKRTHSCLTVPKFFRPLGKKLTKSPTFNFGSARYIPKSSRPAFRKRPV